METIINDPVFGGIILNVVANGISSIIASAWSSASSLLDSNRNLREIITADVPTSTVLQRAATSVANQATHGPPSGDKLRLFLASPEVEGIVRSIFAGRMIDGTREISPSLEELFCKLLQAHVGISETAPAASELFAKLCLACERALSTAIENGALGPHEANSNRRFRLLISEITGIHRRLDALVITQTVSLQAIRQFESHYRRQVLHRYSTITPPHIDTQTKVALDKLYVAPDFFRDSEVKDTRETSVSLDDLEFCIHRTVLLGNPGGGKSTFAIRLAYDAARRYKQGLVGGRHLTPILVVLRDYGTWRRTNSSDLREFMGILGF